MQSRFTKRTLVLAAVVVMFAQVTSAANQIDDAHHLLGIEPTSDLRIKYLSADGSTFVGVQITNNSPQAFRWSSSEGLTYIGLPNSTKHSPLAISADGSQVVGYSWNGDTSLECTTVFQWEDQTGAQPLLGCIALPRIRSISAATASGDGLVANYSRQQPDFTERRDGVSVFKRVGDGFDEIELAVPPDSRGVSISSDGRVVVGNSQESGAFRWTTEGGMVTLPLLPRYTHLVVEPTTTGEQILSADGSVIVATAGRNNGVSIDRQAVRWSEGAGTEGLGFVRGFKQSAARAVTADGEVVVGNANHYTPPDSYTQTAWVWDAHGKMRELRSVLVSEFGMAADLQAFPVLASANSISADRRTIHGAARMDGSREYVLRLDRPLVAFSSNEVPGDFTGDRLVDVNDVDVLMSAIRDHSTETPYDLNGSGAIDDGDLTALIHGPLNTWLGDANLDGLFSSRDFTSVFLAGEYEDAIDDNSGWAEGDWNGDGNFTSGDFVTAFLDGGYEQGPRAAMLAVPEPNALLILVLDLAGTALLRRRR